MEKKSDIQFETGSGFGPEPQVADAVKEAMETLLDQEAARLTDDDMMALASDCEWPFEHLDPELSFKQVVMWHTLDREEPATRKTPLRRFVEEQVKDPGVKRELLKAEHPTWGAHTVREIVKDGVVVLEDEETGTRRTTVVTQNTFPHCRPGARLEGVVHPFGDHWRTNGILTLVPDEEDLARSMGLITSSMMDDLMEGIERRQAEKAESIRIRENAGLRSLLNKYPAVWIDGICASLGLSAAGRKAEKTQQIASELLEGGAGRVVADLDDDACQALLLIMEKGGTIGVGQLAKRFDTAVGWFWVERPPSTPVGQLRAHGLVVVGKMAGPGGRMYRTAMVPKELRPAMEESLRGGG